MKYLIGILLLLNSLFVFGQSQAKIETEFDSICNLGLVELKSYLINQFINCDSSIVSHSKIEYLRIDKINIDLNRKDSYSIDFFEEMNIKRINWSLNQKQNGKWISKIQISTSKNLLYAMEEIKIDFSQKRHRLEKRFQSGKLITSYPSAINYLDIHNFIFTAKNEDLKSNEMYLWMIMERGKIEYNLSVK